MRKYLSVLLFIFPLLTLNSKERQLVGLTPSQIESVFINQNLHLIAEKMNIEIADAVISQAKLWDNPTLSVSQVNLWSTKSQRDGESEVIPPLFGSFARNTEFSIELSQLIQTAGKRSKLVERERLSKDMAIREFEEVLRGLKIELRKNMYEILYLQDCLHLTNKQQVSLSELIEAYKKQVEQGNIAKSELLRLLSSYMEFQNETNEMALELQEQQKTLKTLLHAEPDIQIEIVKENTEIPEPSCISLESLFDLADSHRPDYNRLKIQTDYFGKNLTYEKAQRYPDLTISAVYDRYGGVWKDFIGVGVSIDLPLFNRNQGGIKEARILQRKSQYQEQQHQLEIQQEIASAFGKYEISYLYFQKINENELLKELDQMVEIYTKNLLTKNISMLEFIDFMNTYKSNSQIILTAKKNLYIQFEELQFAVGTEIN